MNDTPLYDYSLNYGVTPDVTFIAIVSIETILCIACLVLNTCSAIYLRSMGPSHVRTCMANRVCLNVLVVVWLFILQLVPFYNGHWSYGADACTAYNLSFEYVPNLLAWTPFVIILRGAFRVMKKNCIGLIVVVILFVALWVFPVLFSLPTAFTIKDKTHSLFVYQKLRHQCVPVPMTSGIFSISLTLISYIIPLILFLALRNLLNNQIIDPKDYKIPSGKNMSNGKVTTTFSGKRTISLKSASGETETINDRLKYQRIPSNDSSAVSIKLDTKLCIEQTMDMNHIRNNDLHKEIVYRDTGKGNTKHIETSTIPIHSIPEVTGVLSHDHDNVIRTCPGSSNDSEGNTWQGMDYVTSCDQTSGHGQSKHIEKPQKLLTEQENDVVIPSNKQACGLMDCHPSGMESTYKHRLSLLGNGNSVNFTPVACKLEDETQSKSDMTIDLFIYGDDISQQKTTKSVKPPIKTCIKYNQSPFIKLKDELLNCNSHKQNETCGIDKIHNVISIPNGIQMEKMSTVSNSEQMGENDFKGASRYLNKKGACDEVIITDSPNKKGVRFESTVDHHNLLETPDQPYITEELDDALVNFAIIRCRLHNTGLIDATTDEELQEDLKEALLKPVVDINTNDEQEQQTRFARTFLVITALHFLFWLPFYVMSLLSSKCDNCHVNIIHWHITLMFTYLDISLNPFLIILNYRG